MRVLGIDVGGTGIKGAPVDPATGELVEERLKLPTPRPAAPRAVAKVVAEVASHFGESGPVGVTFPGVVIGGVVHSAANVDPSWLGVDAQELFGEALGREVRVCNDADAAGLAEMRYGVGRDVQGLVIMTTLGTGIGSALFIDGVLVPNTELGHLEIRGKEAEKRASELVRESHDLSWEEWADRLSEYFRTLEALFSPQLIIIGGGVSKKSEKFLPLLERLRAPIVAAAMHNNAGIAGAALYATG
ncbi:polyphosphate--glucose phosphotransferase [Actinocorallia longicatena]|uniref:ROK family protein n=1 Tax=Actinocorallia longicatena TaxID=111803 RepID=A0ABP6QNX1_9ACTN